MQTTLDILVDGLTGRGLSALLIGGNALPAYGIVRQTLDVDCLMVDADTEALAQVMEPNGYAEKDRTENFVRYSHSSPSLMDLDVVLVDRSTFQKMFRASNVYRIGDRDVRVPSMAHLIALKLHAMRNKPEREKKDMRDILDLLEKNRHIVSVRELRALCRQYGPEDIEVKLGDFL
jgi:hypothetical protein